MASSAKKHPPITLFIGLLLTAFPIAVFWYTWSRFAVNVPKWDDHALKNFLYQLYNQPASSDKVLLFFGQHNEHRIVYDRFLTWLDFLIWGKLSYVRLMLIGNLSLLGLLAVFGNVFRHLQSSQYRWLLLLAPISFLIFNLSQWENMFWGMAALQNFTVVLWVLLAIYLLALDRSLYWTLLVAVLATLTSGNGILIWPIGGVLLLVQRKYKELSRWGGCAIAILILYFWGYEKPGGNPPIRGSLADLLKGWFAFIGAADEAFARQSTLSWCIVFGGLLAMGLTAFGGWRFVRLMRADKSQRQSVPYQIDLFLLGSLAFVLGTGAIVAWSRTGFGLDTLITSRYKIYSLTLLALGYTALITHTTTLMRQSANVGWLIASILLAWFSYTAYIDETIWWRQWMLTNQFNWTYTTNRPVSVVDPTTARWINNAPAFYDHILPQLYKPATESTQPLAIQKNKEVFTVTDSASANPFGRDAGTYLLLRSPKRIYLFQTTPNLQHSLRAKIGLQSPFSSGFTTRLAETDLDSATYQIERLLVHPDGTIERHPTGQQLVARTQASQEIKKNW